MLNVEIAVTAGNTEKVVNVGKPTSVITEIPIKATINKDTIRYTIHPYDHLVDFNFNPYTLKISPYTEAQREADRKARLRAYQARRRAH